MALNCRSIQIDGRSRSIIIRVIDRIIYGDGLIELDNRISSITQPTLDNERGVARIINHENA